jgi:glycosyltransferase involved in cell wall biosynthesis
MKILHILDERWDSGLTQYGLSLATGQKERGYGVWVATRSHTFAHGEAVRRGLARTEFSTARNLRQFVGRETIRLIHAHTGPGHLYGYLAAVGRNIGLVRSRGEARFLSRRPGQAVLYRRTDGVAAASRKIEEQYRALYPFLGERLRVIYPGAEIPPLTPETPGPLRFALVGRLDPVKGHRIFLRALASIRDQLTDQQFILAGEEKGILRSELRAMAVRLNVDSWVRHEGRLPDVGFFMSQCHGGVVASMGSEALSRVTLEWMARGRPLVATTVGCLPELVHDGVHGLLVPPGDAAGLGRALLALVRDETLRLRLGRAAWESAQERFSRERFLNETEALYLNALARRL